jgi:hypothetical protein
MRIFFWVTIRVAARLKLDLNPHPLKCAKGSGTCRMPQS